LKVLLIVPPYPVEEYPALSTGSMYVAAMLQGQGHPVEVLDLLISEASRENVERALARSSPDLVGITSVTMTFPVASEILSWVRDARTDVRTVMGGAHVSFAAERSLRECPAADVIVRGEGERTILDLVDAIERDRDLSTVQGITFRHNGSFHSTPDRPLVEALDSLPFPSWDLLPLSRYRALRGKVGVLSSRGCPHGCIFCVGQRMVGRKGRYRTPELVVDEIEWLTNRGFTAIGIDDDLFTLKKGHALAVCAGIQERRLPITWHAFARVDTVTPEILGTMADAGCSDVLYGVESGSQEILDRIGKRITLDQVRDAVRMGEKAGIRIFASFILGLPGETRETLRATADFAKSLGCQYGFHVLSPFPGTRVWEDANQFGLRILTERWDHYDANHVVTLTPHIAPQDVQEILEEYDAGIEAYSRVQEANIRKGTASPRDRDDAEKRAFKPLAWEILRRDLIEKHGNITEPIPRPEAKAHLALRISQGLSSSFSRVRETLDVWEKEGVLRSDSVRGAWSWRWATNDELVSR
jgi:anaerobic magnesium-protoporphyrin IX monomethyl ester cyclase